MKKISGGCRRCKPIRQHAQLWNNVYSYDKVGNILSIENNALKPANGQKGGASLYSYTYDNHYRLTGATGEYESAITGTHTYQLDMSYGTTYEILTKERHHYLDGVEQQENRLDMGYEYNSAQPHAASKIGGDVYEYDKNGNLVFIDRHDLSQRGFVWDDADRLSFVQDDYRQTSFFYDFSGERVIKSRSSGRLVYVNGQLVQSLSGVHDNFTTYVSPEYIVDNEYTYTKFVYMGSRRITAKVCDGSPETPAKPDPRGNEPNTEYENLQFFFHSDHLGSTSYLTDLSGEVSQHVEYFPYGGIMTEEKNSAVNEGNTPYLFNGKELDQETGLYYYGARYYDTHQWLGVDPLAEFYPNISTYTYCAGNPIGCRDENGEWLNFVVGAVVGAATDYGLQVAINLAEGKDLGDALTDVDGKSIGTSAVLGATGAGILSNVKKIVKTGKILENATKAKKLQERAAKLNKVDRAGKDFTKAGKEIIKEQNKLKNAGKIKCNNCKTKTQNPQKHVKSKTPPRNEAHVDHKMPKSKGGRGNPDNGQILCRDCN